MLRKTLHRDPEGWQQVSLRKLASLLGVSKEILTTLAGTAGRYYKPFPKKKGDKVRYIDRPVGELKKVQYLVYKKLLLSLEFPEYMHGGIRGRSPSTNCQPHLGQKYVIRIDVRDFFRSVTNSQVFAVWRTLGYSPTLAHLLTQLTTYRGYLPQGAPTSAALANLVLMPADEEVLASTDAIIYTRFVDDIGVSGDYPQDYIDDVVVALRRLGFRVKHKKLNIQPRTSRQKLTGYLVNREGSVSKSRSYRDNVRAAIHQLPNEIKDEAESEKSVRSIRGRIRHIEAANPGAARRLSKLLDRRLGESISR